MVNIPVEKRGRLSQLRALLLSMDCDNGRRKRVDERIRGPGEEGDFAMA